MTTAGRPRPLTRRNQTAGNRVKQPVAVMSSGFKSQRLVRHGFQPVEF